MPAAFPIRWQMERRLDSARQRLAVALIISLVLHALIYGAWQAAPATAKFLKEAFTRVPLKPPAARQAEMFPEPPAPKREVPLVFVEIDPAHAAKEPPKETKNYSTDNSLAANPVPKNLETPKIEGRPSPVLRTMDTPKPQPKPLEPKPPEPEPQETKATEPEVKPKNSPPPGDLAMAKPPPPNNLPKATELTPQREDAPPKPRPRPRTLAEARARNPSIAGEKSAQDGGVQQRAHIAMVDARSSVFGDYDRTFISLVQSRWYQLLDNNQYMMDRRGKVALTFRLHFDGRISQLEIAENTVGDMLALLCQKAILDPAPFPKWPAEMRRQIQNQGGTEYRDVKFTFYYD